MAKILLLGLALLSLIGLATFGALASGYGTGMLNNNFLQGGGRGGCYMNEYNDQDSNHNDCYVGSGTNCGGANSDECEEYCEENGNGTISEDCPRGYQDCPYSGGC